jgi:hypothetical protein
MPPPDDHDGTPAELAANQDERERVERERAAEATDDRDARAHERRAEKAGYLRQKLEDQVEAERPDADG